MPALYNLTVDDVVTRVRAGLQEYADTIDVQYYDIAELLDAAYRRTCVQIARSVPHAFARSTILANGDLLPDDFFFELQCLLETPTGSFVARRVVPQEWISVLGDNLQSWYSHGQDYQPAYVIWSGYDVVPGNLVAPATQNTTGVDMTTVLAGPPRIYFVPDTGQAHFVYCGIPTSLTLDAGGLPLPNAPLPVIAEFQEIVVRELMIDVALAVGLDYQAISAIELLLSKNYESIYRGLGKDANPNDKVQQENTVASGQEQNRHAG